MNKKRILVIEDNESMREMLKEYLELQGYEVETAGNGKEAIPILKRQGFDLVITDFNMPEINGIGVIKFIKQRDPDTKIKIILLSAEDMRLVFPQAKNAGADKVLPKPLDFPHFQKTIKELLV